ncbi:MAG: 50S ribosomal protein L11 methyltransferase [Muribaculaceae bacterium]|nr:50S ribosomal protein L11 methyltransferase [Muribaculaceae bacterium]
MNDYIETRLDFTPDGAAAPETGSGIDLQTATDVMAALLCDIGYESFSPDDSGMTAFVRKEAFDDEALKGVLREFPFEGFLITCSTKTIEGQDWNREWEKNYFKPIVVGDECVIHSSFHKDIPACTYDIVIDPKMAFGTGHHATTSLIIERLLGMDLEGKSVIDMGTGTGILAILAAMRGAAPVTAIEIDPAAELNARENVKLNGHPEIDVRLGDAMLLAGLSATLFIANINRNIITADLAAYNDALLPGGTMLLSGFYEADIPVIMETARPLGLVQAGHTVKGDGWACLELRKS